MDVDVDEDSGQWASLHSACTRRDTGTDPQRDRGGNRHTVETGHNVGLTAITSKVIGTPSGKKQNHRRRGRRWVVEE